MSALSPASTDSAADDGGAARAAFPRATTEFVRPPDGARLHCLHAGVGPAVLLAHGFLLDATIFEFVFASLVDAGYRVIAFDQRGHGSSTIGRDGVSVRALVSDYRALLEHFAVQDGVFVGHSMGAFLAIALCLHEPATAARLRRLVLVGANAGAVAVGSPSNRLQLPLLKSGLLQPLWRRPRIGRLLVAQLFGPNPDPRLVERTRATLLRQHPRPSLPMAQAMLDEDYYDRLGEIRTEAIVICGEHDRTCPAWHSRRLGAELPRAHNVWLPNAGHMVSFEAPGALVEAVCTGS